MKNKKKYDFGGWATKNDLLCADGRIIRKNAFSKNDGQVVPLVYGHNHKDPSAVLGHALLENRDEGVFAYCSFNGTAGAKDAKEAIEHGDITALSIWANNLVQVGRDVMHGAIREVSLVLAGANPGAFVESVLQHGVSIDDDDEEGIIYTNESLIISHAIESEPEPEPEDKPKTTSDDNKSLKEIYNTFTEEQKQAVAAIVSELFEENGPGTEEPGEDDDVSHGLEMEENNMNIFETLGSSSDVNIGGILSHDDMREIFKEARRVGSFRIALDQFQDENGIRLSTLAHAVPTDGMTVGTGNQKYGVANPELLYPDYKSVSNTPDFISRDMTWVSSVMNNVKNVPFARIKTLHADITEDEARARGYIKGKQKKEEVFTLLKRTTDPQTFYKKQKLDKDDLYDIEDFDMALWLKGEMDVMLNEEQARAILIGDGRAADSEDKIQPNKIRPIASDVDLYNTKVTVTKGSTDEETARNYINSVIKSRKKYKGSGNPSLYTTEDMLTDMLLIENKIGEKVYKTEQELATALRVKEIIPVEPMETATVNGKSVLGIIVNLNDYQVGHPKKIGETDAFEDFDIDYNQYKYLKERRISGALAKPFSAITILGAAQADSTFTNSNPDQEPEG